MNESGPDESAIRAAISDAMGSTGQIEGVEIGQDGVTVVVAIAPEAAADIEPKRKAAMLALERLGLVGRARIVLTAHRAPNAAQPKAQSPAANSGIPGVKTVIAVASGKGGVGKSTTAVNLALALKAIGLNTALLDADIYGPSIPRLLGLKGKPQAEDKKLLPMVAYDLAAMSIGFLVDEQTAMIWRGPMVMSALTQMMQDVLWTRPSGRDIDVLVIDMPPGTGDAQLTIAQKVPLAGAVIVSTPQDIALIDARRGIAMFDKTKVPCLGLIENMSFYVCPNCGHEAHIFGHGGARDTAAELGVEFLGEVPLEIEIRITSDEGRPIVIADPDSAGARAYRAMAARIADKLAMRNFRSPPRIVHA